MRCEACGLLVCSGTDCAAAFPESQRRRDLDNRPVGMSGSIGILPGGYFASLLAPRDSRQGREE